MSALNIYIYDVDPCCAQAEPHDLLKRHERSLRNQARRQFKIRVILIGMRIRADGKMPMLVMEPTPGACEAVGVTEMREAVEAVGEGGEEVRGQVFTSAHFADVIKEVRGGRGGRGSTRRGRGVSANANGFGHTSAVNMDQPWPTSTETTTDGWADQIGLATTANGDDNDGDGGWGLTTSKVEVGEWDDGPLKVKIADTSKGDDFSAAGGWGDAPAPKELEMAAETGGTGWQEEIKKPVPIARSTAGLKSTMTWAQIAK